jgi:predicted TIM-barrel enzyme
MPRFARQKLLSKYAEMVRRRQPIIGGGAGTGLSAKCEEAGGVDLIVIYNSGRYRMAGRGSLSGLLAYGNANDVVMEMAKEVLPVVKKTPVLAGVNGTDPFCVFDTFLDDIAAIGFSGVQNFPTVGLIDGNFRQNLEETGITYALEVEMIRLAHEKDLLTTPYVFDAQQAEVMTRAGADIIVAHMGRHRAGCARRALRHDRALSRRPHCRTGRCGMGVEQDAPLSWLLRRQFDGAVAHGKSHHRSDPRLQANHFLKGEQICQTRSTSAM